ncbi:MAG: glutaredoxin family protein [Rhodocyclales bacterium]|nr:glutaredoxin family protein [Rhodocyclales bacterium]
MNSRLTIALIAALLASFAAQAQTTYRWVDPATGRTIFSDQPPPAGVKPAGKREAAETSDEGPISYAARVAAEKFPVVLYTSADCIEACNKGRNLLNERGTPFQEKMVQGGTPELEELKKVTGGEAFVPVILVGRQHVKGFEAAGWNNLLDLAGYPKTAPFGSKPSSPLTPPAQ